MDNTDAGVLQTQITDHFSLIMSMSKYNTFKQECIAVKSVNYNMLSNILKEEMRKCVLYVKYKWLCCYLYVKIWNAVEKSRFLFKLNSKNKRLKEWMTLGLLNSNRKKHDLSKKTRKHPLNT